MEYLHVCLVEHLIHQTKPKDKMDLPIKLETEETVSGVDEIKQTLIALFTNETKSFMQSSKRGCTGIIATTGSWILANLYVQGVIDQVAGCKLQALSASYDQNGEALTIDVFVSYNLQSLKLSYQDGEWS